jgi:hypothetical protein
MKKIAMAFLLLLIPALTMKAQTSSVSGKVIGGKGFTIRLMTYSDQVSYLRETLMSSITGDDESFNFTFENNTVLYCWLDIEFQKVELFIQPGQSYEIEIELKNQSLSTS